VQRRELLQTEFPRPASRAAPRLAHLLDERPVPLHRNVPRLLARERLRQHASSLGSQLRRYRLHRFAFARGTETEVLYAATERERRSALLGVERELRFARAREPPYEVRGDLRSLHRRARNPHLVREVANVPRDRAPAPTHARLRDAHFVAVGR